MARMIPTEPDMDTPAAERYVFGRLREGLPDTWTVLHARRFSLPESEAHAAEEYEVDFAVIDPARGIVAVDVGDAASQAQSAARALDRFLAAQPWFARSGVRPPFASGVLPSGVELGDPRGAIDRIFAASGCAPAPLAEEAVAAAIRALAPALRLIRPLAARIERESVALVRLTQEQAHIIGVLGEMPRVAIEGAAGTGKTMLAMEWADRLATRGLRVLLLCFNRLLSEFLAKQAGAGFEVRSFHRACYELCQRAGVPFEVPASGESQRRFWDLDAPRLLVDSLTRLPEARFDAIVVDEGQDFRAEWWPAVESLLAVPGSSRLVVFFDPNQEIYPGGPAKSLEVSPSRLAWNCRNTGYIARFSHAVIGKEAELHPGAPEGAVVELAQVRSEAEGIAEVRRNLHRLLHDEGLRSDQIVVLSTRSRENSPLAKAALGGIALCPLDAVPGPNQVRFGSLHQFKGLEADAVILADVHAGDPNSSPRHVYVASSRARHLLVVVQRLDD